MNNNKDESTRKKIHTFMIRDRLKNAEVVEQFLDYRFGSNHNRSLRILEDKLMSYDTIIARRSNDSITILNPEYSPTITTKKHINILLKKCSGGLNTIKISLNP